MAARNDFWTDEKVAECHRLYVVDGRTARETARLIGAVSDNAIIGKAHRMGWTLPIERIPNPKRPRLDPDQRRRRQAELARARYVPRARTPRPLKAPALRPTEFIGVAKGGKLPRMDGNMPADAAPIPFRFRPRGRCCWPIGEVGQPATCETLVCGAPVGDDEASYCETHRRLSTNLRPAPRRRQSETISDRRAA